MITTVNNGVVGFVAANGASLVLRPAGEGRVDFVYSQSVDTEGHALHPSLLKDVALRVLGTNELDSFFDAHFVSLSNGTFGL